MYIILFLILIVLSVAYLKVAEKLNIIDKPNQRSSHTIPTIRGGGILFVFAFFIYQITVEFKDVYLSIAVLLIAVVSFIDDMKTLSAKLRFPFQVLAVTLVMYEIGLFTLPIWIPLLAIFACTAFINFYNFMDGINGITGLYSISVLLGMFLVNTEVSVLNNDLIGYEILALIVFGFYNFRKKARFFAGDIGSIAMALILVYMLINLFYQKESPIYVLLLVVYGADATLTMFYRIMIKENLTEAHRHHIYQKLVDRSSLTHLQVAGLYSVLQILIAGLVWCVLPYSILVHFIVTGAVITVLVILYFVLFSKMEKRIR